MVSQIRRALIVGCFFSGIIFFFYSTNQVATPLMEKPVITCTTEDYTDTPFIQTVKENETVHIPDTSILDKLSREELASLYHRYVTDIQYLCKRKVRIGNIEDGGWDICDEDKYRPKQPCLVYSFGINNDFSFDDAIIKRYGCEVHSFDPSMGSEDYSRGHLNKFHALGLSAQDEVHGDWKMLRYDTIRSQLAHAQSDISILKIDIEKWEWNALPDIIRSGSLSGTDNIAVELHLDLASPEQGRDMYRNALYTLRDLYNLGYRIFWTNQNKWCKFVSKCKEIARTNCHEVNFVKVR